MGNHAQARQDVRDALYALLLAYQVSDATLRRVESSRPRSFPETPLAYPDYIDETQTHADGTRTRSQVPTIMLVTTFSETEENVIDGLVDGLQELFTANPQPAPFDYGVIQLLKVDDGVEAQELIPSTAGIPFRGTRFTFTAVAQGGRL